MSNFWTYLSVIAIAAVPVIELRGAIPWGVSQGLEPLVVLLLGIVGNLIPVPFIILFVRRVFAWMKRKSTRLGKIAEALEKRAENKMDMIVRYETLGLFVFVAIPLPGTGAWTGSLIAALLGLRLKNACPAIALGVVAAGIIMTVISYGVSALIM